MLWWISFAQSGHRNLGCCMVEAHCQASALERAEQLGIHPGGDSVQVIPIDPNGSDAKTFPKDTLISREDLISNGYTSNRQHIDD